MIKSLYLLVVYGILQSSVIAVEPPANGALIFTEHGSCLVSTYTKSTYSHVAIILYERGIPIVFEAKPGGTIKSTYASYLHTAVQMKANEGKSISLWLMNPKHPYSRKEINAMLDKANDELGTPYSVIPTLLGNELHTLQCSQFVSLILQTSPRFWFRSPKYQTPSSLLGIAKPGYKPMSLVKQFTSKSSSLFQRLQQLIK